MSGAGDALMGILNKENNSVIVVVGRVVIIVMTGM
jgi:hypothetical protein